MKWELTFALVAAIAVDAMAADATTESRPVRLEHLAFIRLTDEQIFACACPGVVDFCKEWKEKWAVQAAPEVRNQSVRECVIDMMLAIEGKE